MDLRQFKLNNDDEIICEVVEWNDEEHDTMVVRKAMKIVTVDDMETSMRYYTFRPWMSMNTNPDTLHVLNSYHILAESQPSPVAEEYFYDIIKEMKNHDDEKDDDGIFRLSEMKQDSDRTDLIEFNKEIVH